MCIPVINLSYGYNFYLYELLKCDLVFLTVKFMLGNHIRNLDPLPCLQIRHVVQELEYSNIGATELVLSNGMRICYKRTDFLDDQVPILLGIAYQIYHGS